MQLLKIEKQFSAAEHSNRIAAFAEKKRQDATTRNIVRRRCEIKSGHVRRLLFARGAACNTRPWAYRRNMYRQRTNGQTVRELGPPHPDCSSHQNSLVVTSVFRIIQSYTRVKKITLIWNFSLSCVSLIFTLRPSCSKPTSDKPADLLHTANKNKLRQ